MQAITQAQLAEMKDRFLPDRPGPLIGLHIIHTGYGTAHVDRWPEPNVLLVNTAGNYSLCGDPDYLNVANLQANVSGFVEAPPSFLSGLKAAFPDVLAWDRVILQLAERPTVTSPDNSRVRRLDKGDAAALRALSAEVSWVAKTWGGTDGLAESGYAWGAFVENRLVSIACTFFVGETCEDIGVATEPAFRRQGPEYRLRRSAVRRYFQPRPQTKLDHLPRQHRQPSCSQKAGFCGSAPGFFVHCEYADTVCGLRLQAEAEAKAEENTRTCRWGLLQILGGLHIQG